MDKSTNQMTDKDIKVLEEMRDEWKRRGWADDPPGTASQWFTESDALTAILDYYRDTREMFKAANSIGFQNYFLTRISPDTWVMHSDDEANNGVQFDSALAAWRDGVKGEKE